MAKAKTGSEGKSPGKKAPAPKGGSKSAGSSGESTSKAAKTPPTPSTASKSAAPNKSKNVESKASPVGKDAAVKSSAPGKQTENRSVKAETSSAGPAGGSRQKTGETGKAPVAAPSSTPAKPPEPEQTAQKPVETASPTKPQQSAAAVTAKPEATKPGGQEVKAAVPATGSGQDSSPPAPAASTPVEKIPQWPDVETDSLDGVHLPVAHGKAAIFGGPKDRGVKRDDKLGLPIGAHYQYELVRNLNPKAFYCSMRWEYRQGHMSTEEGKRWWANKRVLVSANGKSVVVKAVDYGPHESSGFSLGISPGAAEALGIEQGDQVDVKFADQKSQLGPII